jgi:hypothetical protein
MRSSCVFRLVRAAAVRVAAIAAMFLVIGRAAPARADNVDELIHQLADDDSDKVRLSAAINLIKLRDQRAVGPLTKALVNDTQPTVRATAAGGLGKLVNAKTDSNDRQEAIAKLSLAKNDPSNFVRVEAAKALKAMGGGAGSTPQTPPTPPQTPQTPQTPTATCYVNIGPMASKTGNPSINPRLKASMVKTANSTIARVASNVATTWPGGVPTQAMLAAKGALGFYVDGTVNDVKATGSGSSMTVSCKINMLLASFPDKSIFGLLNGGGSVQSSGSFADLAEDCVSAVLDDLIAKKIVPTMHSKGCP